MQSKPISDFSGGVRINSKKIEQVQIKQSLSPQKQQSLGSNRPVTSENQISSFQATQSAISQSAMFNARRQTNPKSKNNQLPDINSKGRVPKVQKADTLFQFMQSSQEFQDILLVEKDERFPFNDEQQNGSLRRVENNGNIIFSELPQIQGIWVCYRRPCERQANLEKMNLDYLDLSHMALLEGEEKLKILTYQHNRIGQIENLVSLPNLLYLDLYDNMIKEIDGLKQVPLLKVLLLPKNCITKIQNLDFLQKLEVLDLHSNKIIMMEGISKLKHLRILNLANNQILRIDGVENLTELIELNLKINQVEIIENIGNCVALNKLFLSSNKLIKLPASLPPGVIELSLDNNPISQFTIGGFSTVQTKKAEYARSILQLAEKIKVLDGKAVEQWKEEIQRDLIDSVFHGSDAQIPKSEGTKRKQFTNSTTPAKPQTLQRRTQQPINALEVQGTKSTQVQPPPPGTQNQPQSQNQSYSTTRDQSAIPEEKRVTQETTAGPSQDAEPKKEESEDVISIIKLQWEKEIKRVRKLELQGIQNKKQLIQQSEVEGGHAEIEDDTFLLIYGTAYQIVLPSQNFPEVVDKLHLQYILYDSLIDQCLSVLKNYKKLREITLKDNFICGLLQLAKLESLPNLRSITIVNNPVCNCHFLQQFLVYRFPQLLQINGKDIREGDRNKAKQMFQNFDRILQIPEKFYNPEQLRVFEKKDAQALKRDKVYVKNYNKSVNECVEKLYLPAITKVLEGAPLRAQFENTWDSYVNSLIQGQLKLLQK